MSNLSDKAELEIEAQVNRVSDFRRALLKAGIRLIVVAVVFFFVWRFFDQLGWDELARRVRQANEPLVILAGACIAMRFGLIYLRWSMVLELLKLPLSHIIGWTALMTGVLLNHVTPTARLLGGLVRARGLAKIYQTSFSSIYATILVEQVGNQLVQTFLMWLSVIPFAWTLGWHRAAVAIALVPPIAAVGGLVWRNLRGRPLDISQWSSFVGRRLQAQLRNWRPLMVGGRRIAEIFRAAFSDFNLQIRLAVCGIGIVVANVLALWLVLESLGTQVGILYVFATVSLGLAAGLITGTPGGFATTEAAMIALLVALGVEEIDAAAGVILYRGLHYSMVLVVGGISALAFELTVARRSRSGPSEGHPSDSERPVDESH